MSKHPSNDEMDKVPSDSVVGSTAASAITNEVSNELSVAKTSIPKSQILSQKSSFDTSKIPKKKSSSTKSIPSSELKHPTSKPSQLNITKTSGSSLNNGQDNETTDEQNEDTASIKTLVRPLGIINLMAEDSREFNDPDMNEILPKSRFKDKSFIKLREFFESIISDLEHAQRIGIPLEEVKDEFHYVWDGIQKSHENLEDLLRKDVNISIQLGDTMAKTRNLIRIAEDQPEIAMRLGRRLETAWNLVDISEVEEKRNSERLTELETDITLLNRNITAAANMEGRAELTELMKIRRKLHEERETLTREMGRTRTTLTMLHERKHRQSDKKIEYQEAIKYSNEEAIAQSIALERELSRKERIEKSILETTNYIEGRTRELEIIEQQTSVANSKINELERLIRDQKVLNDVAVREAEQAWSKQEKLKNDVEGQIALVERLAMDAYKRQSELKSKEDEILLVKMEGIRAERQKGSNMKKCETLQERLDNMESEREGLKSKITQLEKDLDKAQRRLEDSKKEVEELDKQRTMVNRNLQRANAVASEHEDNIKINAIAVDNLEGELEGFKREIGNQTETIHRLERERDFYSHEATKLAHIVASSVEQIKRLDISIFDCKKNLTDIEGSLKSQIQNYEAAVVEKQYYDRVLRDTVIEINETGKTIRHGKFEKNGLQYREIDIKNAIIVEEERRDHLVKEADFLKTEASRMKHMAVDIQRETEALEVERSTLGCAVAEAENEIGKQKYYSNSSEARKMNYHRRQMQKEKELKETWEKWRTLHSMVRIGAYHYRNLMKEIHESRLEITGLRRVQQQFKGNTNHIIQLQQEISTLENCISKETCMVNALEDELTRPINIHRWRVLEAIDPEAYSMVKKINIVNKRLVNHNEKIRKQNLRIKDKQNVYVDIKRVLKHLPGLETPEDREFYRLFCISRKSDLALLKHEIYANEAQTSFFRNQVIQLDLRMKQLKEEYFEKKDREQALKTKFKYPWSKKYKTKLKAIMPPPPPPPPDKKSFNYVNEKEQQIFQSVEEYEELQSDLLEAEKTRKSKFHEDYFLEGVQKDVDLEEEALARYEQDFKEDWIRAIVDQNEEAGIGQAETVIESEE